MIDPAELYPGIGTLNEGSLHATLKQLYSQPGDEFEVPLERFVIDIKRDELLIEIQTGSFSALGRKFDHLLPDHNVLLVHPVATETYLDRPGKKPRKSPKRGSIYSLFEKLVSIPTLIDNPHFSLEIVLVSVTKIQVQDPKARRGRGGFRTVDRRLEAVSARHRFDTVDDLMQLVPDDMPDEFTTADLATAADITRDDARRIAYCMRPLGRFVEVGRSKAGYHYTLA